MRLGKYWKNVFVLLGIASVLDPPYKMKYIEYLCSKCEVIDGSSEVALILDAIHNLYDGYVTNDLEKEDPMDDSDSSNLEEEEEEEEEVEEILRSEEQGSSNPSWVQDYNQFIKIGDKPPKSDLDWYLEEPVITWSQDLNALKWWRAKSPKYPTLSKMVRDILAIPTSVATSDGAYCTEPREPNLDRLGRGRDLQNALMCTRRWFVQEESRKQ